MISTAHTNDLSVDMNMNAKAKRPASLSFSFNGESELTSGKQRLQGPAFTTLTSPGGGTLEIKSLPERYQQRIGTNSRNPSPGVYTENEAMRTDAGFDQAAQTPGGRTHDFESAQKHCTASDYPEDGVSGDSGDSFPNQESSDVQMDQKVDKEIHGCKNRERDMDSAIQWIKQELMLMKQQDRLLMRQLLNLRSQIHQIRSAGFCLTTGTDLYSSDESWVSFPSEEALSAPCANSPVTEAEMLASFRDRTIKMMSMPNSPVDPPFTGLNGSMTKMKSNSLQGPKISKIVDITYYV